MIERKFTLVNGQERTEYVGWPAFADALEDIITNNDECTLLCENFGNIVVTCI